MIINGIDLLRLFKKNLIKADFQIKIKRLKSPLI